MIINYERQKKKVPFFLYYFISVIWSNLLFNIVIVFVIFITNGIVIEYGYFVKNYLMTLPFFTILYLFEYAEGITSIIIDEEKKQIVFECHPIYYLFFRKKTKIVSLDSFSFVYEQKHRSLLSYMLPFPKWNRAFRFYPNKSNKVIIFLDFGGWKPSQLDDIYHRLLDDKDTENRLHLKKKINKRNYSYERYETI